MVGLPSRKQTRHHVRCGSSITRAVPLRFDLNSMILDQRQRAGRSARKTAVRSSRRRRAEVSVYEEMSREQLLAALEMFAKNWLAHDGCWFLAAEARHGMD